MLERSNVFGKEEVANESITYKVGAVVLLKDMEDAIGRCLERGNNRAIITKVCDNKEKHISNIYYEVAYIDEHGNKTGIGHGFFRKTFIFMKQKSLIKLEPS